MNYLVTRFAPSPTGNLHLGGVRTALINYIVVQQAKKTHTKSKFLLRIEDTDKKRSDDKFKDSIINGLKWLGIHYDEHPYIQSKRLERHQEIAYALLSHKKAFKCICSNQDLEKKREENKKNKLNQKRLCEKCENNLAIQSLTEGYAIRIKIPKTNQTSIYDFIQGNVKVENKEIDNFIILRNDSSPTYMLSVVVDDYDMGVNLIIRGDDHLNNVFRQFFIYKNMNWSIPQYAHIPLIHGEDGKKLSKRHGALDINEFKDAGYLQEAIINNLILLGWSPSHSNEIVGINDIIKFFDIKKFSKSSSIFNYEKLIYFNNHYIKNNKNYDKLLNFCNSNIILTNYLNTDIEKLKRIFLIYKKNLNFYIDLEKICPLYFNDYPTKNNDLLNETFNSLIQDFILILENLNDWNIEKIENKIKDFINSKKIKFILFGKPFRLMLINSENGPSISEILFILGKKHSIQRIKNYISTI